MAGIGCLEKLREASARCAEIERAGYQATIRLVPAGLQVSVGTLFTTSRRLATLEDIALREENVLLALLDSCLHSMPDEVPVSLARS